MSSLIANVDKFAHSNIFALSVRSRAISNLKNLDSSSSSKSSKTSMKKNAEIKSKFDVFFFHFRMNDIYRRSRHFYRVEILYSFRLDSSKNLKSQKSFFSTSLIHLFFLLKSRMCLRRHLFHHFYRLHLINIIYLLFHFHLFYHLSQNLFRFHYFRSIRIFHRRFLHFRFFSSKFFFFIFIVIIIIIFVFEWNFFVIFDMTRFSNVRLCHRMKIYVWMFI